MDLTPDQRGYGLDASCLKFLNYEKIKTETLLDDSGSIVHAPLSEYEYACEDADLTLRLHKHLKPLVKEQQLENPFMSVDMPLVPVLSKMEQDGIYIDAELLKSFSEELGSKAKELQEKIYGIAGEEFNINSPKQLQVILYEKLKIHEELGIKNIKKTKSGLSTDVSVFRETFSTPFT